jgi:LuxR family maltose regulon positive regulatory protein
VSSLENGWTALGNGDWERAKESFEEYLADGDSPEAQEGLGWAGHMLNDEQLTFDSRKSAYRLYPERGEKGSAARIAALLAADSLLFRGEAAVANGWLQRAHSLIDDLEPGIDHGWLAIHEGHIAVSLDENTTKARRLAAHAVELGRSFGVPEIEMLGLGLEGRALVSEGDLEEGMRRLDEATTLALQGEARLLYCVAWACCYVISACERVRDYERATQWCGRVGEFCDEHDIFLLNTCSAHYASVLSWQGRWEEAESQLTAAVDGLEASRPLMVGDALARLGELRRRQGRLEEAEGLFARTEAHSLSLLGRASLALERGEYAEAVDVADRYLRRFAEPTRVERTAGLEVAIRALAHTGEYERAAQLLSELREIAARTPTRPLLAAVCSSEGVLAMTRAEHDPARRSFEDALDFLASSDSVRDCARPTRSRRRVERVGAPRSSSSRGRDRTFGVSGDGGREGLCSCTDHARRTPRRSIGGSYGSRGHAARRAERERARGAQSRSRGIHEPRHRRASRSQRAHSQPACGEHPPQARTSVEGGRGIPRRHMGWRSTN